MARKEDPRIGTYDISTGTAEIAADDLRDGGYLIYVNGVPSSHVVIGQPEQLEFEYMRWIAGVVEEHVDKHVDPAKLRVTHLGGAGCTLARYFANVWPCSRHTAVEIDAKLAELVREHFDIPRSPTVKIRVGEARAVTDGFHPGSRDVIIRDVFAGDTTPRPLSTVEFYRAAHSSLAPGGLYVANCGSHSDLAEAKAELAGMAEVFEHLAVIADPPMLKGRRYGNVILIGSDNEIAASPALTRRLLGGAMPAQFKDDAWARALFSGTAARHDEA